MTVVDRPSRGGSVSSEKIVTLADKNLNAAKDQLPFGLPRVIVAGVYFLILCLSGMAIGAPDPIQEIMKQNSALAHLESTAERNAALAQIVGFGYSSALISGVLAGFIYDFLGPKLTALLGLTLHGLGYTFLFCLYDSALLYYIGTGMFGLAFQLIFNSHMSIGCLFPRNSNLVISILGAGPDISLFVPYVMQIFTEQSVTISADDEGALPDNSAVRQIIVQYLLFVVLVLALLDLFLLPAKPYTVADLPHLPDVDIEGYQSEETPLVTVNNESRSKRGSFISQKLEAAADSVQPAYWGLSLFQQMQTPQYWIFVPFFVVTFLRKKHFAISLRSIFAEYAPNEASMHYWTGFYNFCVPYGFIPAILWGGLIDKFGITSLMFASNTMGIVFSGLSMIGLMWVQFFTIIVFIIYGSFVFGMGFAFCASVFGFKNLATLQGVISTLSGILSMAMDAFWPQFITHKLESFRSAAYIMIGAGVLIYICPVLLSLLGEKKSPPSRKFDKDVTKEAMLASPNEILQAPGPLYERSALHLYDQQARASIVLQSALQQQGGEASVLRGPSI